MYEKHSSRKAQADPTLLLRHSLQVPQLPSVADEKDQLQQQYDVNSNALVWALRK